MQSSSSQSVLPALLPSRDHRALDICTIRVTSQGKAGCSRSSEGQHRLSSTALKQRGLERVQESSTVALRWGRTAVVCQAAPCPETGAKVTPLLSPGDAKFDLS